MPYPGYMPTPKSALKSAYALSQKALFWKWFNFVQIFFWLALIPVAIWLEWSESVTFVTTISLIALALSAQASWQASRNEYKEDVRDPDMDVE